MRIGFIGTGAMSSAIAKGLRAAGDDTSQIFLQDIRNDKAQELATAVKGTAIEGTTALMKSCDIVILGVKPGVQPTVLKSVAKLTQNEKSCPALISIAAGRSIKAIRGDLANFGAEYLPPLIRVMPNVNAQVGLSMSALCTAKNVTDETRDEALHIFNAVGECIELPEEMFGVFSALAGASPAWFFQIVDSFARAGVKYGMTKAQALQSVTQAMLGSARTVQTSIAEGVNPSELIDRVCSPGGTTIAGLLAAQEAGLDTALVKAVDATVLRDQELG